MNIAKLAYPRPISRKEIIIPSALLALTVYFFLSVFQPFGTYTFYDPLKYVLLIPYSLFAFLGFTMADLIVKKQLENWSLSHETIKVIIVLIACSAVNYWYSATFINNTAYSAIGLMYMSLFTFLVGAPVSILYLLGRYLYLRRIETNPPTLSLPTLGAVQESQPEIASRIITIQPKVGAHLIIAETDFLCGDSQGNYCNVFYLDKGTIRKQLLRIPLKHLEEQISSQTIVRCHRSFIVNLSKIARAKGNAQGYLLYMEHLEMAIPVSRSFTDVIRKQSDVLCRP